MTQADWARYEAYLNKWSKGSKGVAKLLQGHRKRAARTQFKPYPKSSGDIGFCNETYGKKFGCTLGLKISQSRQLALAQQVLDKTEPGCKIGRLNPPEIRKYYPYNLKTDPKKRSPGSVSRPAFAATVDCG